MRKDQIMGGLLIATLGVLVVVGMWKTSGDRQESRPAVQREYRGVMGTDCTLAAVVLHDRQLADAEAALGEARASLATVESLMSSWLDDSEISRLNTAAADVEVPLSPQTLDVLRESKRAFELTDGAFDVTCRPLVELWRNAAKAGKLPSEDELKQARSASAWDLIELRENCAVKRIDTARVDLGGIAKGYAIDRAVDVLRGNELEGGLVNVGGDLRCFGSPPTGDRWPVEVRDPSRADALTTLRLAEGAVCTSGDYERFHEIDGRRYSHIIDPRDGSPADAITSVTVIAPTALKADIWATALSVLGPEGLERLPEAVEAMMLQSTTDGEKLRHASPGFERLRQMQ